MQIQPNSTFKLNAVEKPSGIEYRSSYCFLHSDVKDMPSEQIQLAVGRGEWTKGGMAEAGWYFVGEMDGGGPIFSRTPSIKAQVKM